MNANQFLSIEDTRNKIGAWRVDYNLHRPHSSLRQLTPRKHLRRSEEEEDEASFFRLKKALKREPEHTFSGLYSFTILFAGHLTIGLSDRQGLVRLMNFEPIFVDSQSPDFCIKRWSWKPQFGCRAIWPGDTARTF